MAEELKRQKDVRKAYRGHCTQNMKEAETIMFSENEDDSTLIKLEDLLQTVTKRMEKITLCDDKIESMASSETVETEISDALQYSDRLMEFTNKVERILSKYRHGQDIPDRKEIVTETRGVITETRGVRLPKMVIKDFTGDPLEWNAFWDSFHAAVDCKSSMRNVEKMNYLVSFLKDDAERAIKGLSLTDANYTIAVDILKKRFGNKQCIINAYMNAMMEIPDARDDVKSLRTFYDTMEGYIRGMEALAVSPFSYGYLLMPVLLRKLPEDLRCGVRRQI